MLDKIKVFRQSSIKFFKDKIIYFDPFKIDEDYNDADFIFITHDHFDHFDVESINKVKKDSTVIVVPKTLQDSVSNIFDDKHIVIVSPNNEYEIDGLVFETIRAYNNNKQFHPKSNDWVGYKIYIEGVSYYIMGDTDDTVDARNVQADVLFVPIGGTYTMTVEEAVEYVNFVKPKYAIPIHYGEVVGNIEDGEYFIKNINEDIKGKILIK